jgi:hypothetical protein
MQVLTPMHVPFPIRVPVPVVPSRLVDFNLLTFLESDPFKLLIAYNKDRSVNDTSGFLLSYPELWSLMNTSKLCRIYVKKALDATNRGTLWSEWVNNTCRYVARLGNRERIRMTQVYSFPYEGDVTLSLTEATNLATRDGEANLMVRGEPGSWYGIHKAQTKQYKYDPNEKRMKWEKLENTIYRTKMMVNRAITRRLAEYAVTIKNRNNIAKELYQALGGYDTLRTHTRGTHTETYETCRLRAILTFTTNTEFKDYLFDMKRKK